MAQPSSNLSSPVKKPHRGRLSTAPDGHRPVPAKVLKVAKETLEASHASSVIVEQVHYQGSHSRRLRTPWTEQECENLRRGVEVYGESSWATILRAKELKFHENRTAVDLKDKWRNLVSYRQYGTRPIRSYILVDQNHQPLLNQNGHAPVLRNRYPRDAAMKIATRDEYYKNGNEFIDIYLMESVGENNCPPIVHVYRGTRQKYIAADIPKFENSATMWVASVEKVKEEQLFDRSTILTARK